MSKSCGTGDAGKEFWGNNMEQIQTYRILWQERKDGGARLLRIYGTSPQVFIPAKITGHPCVEIAPYCFAPKMQLPQGEYQEDIVSAEKGFEPYLQELCKNAVEEVILPDTVEEIGNCAFYDCRQLKQLHMGPAVHVVGSDAFMNTLSLQKILLRCPADEKSGIQKILSQISSSIEVCFQSGNRTEAVLLYPEYYESYDEIAPAHLFGRSITGEGFRARQCFQEGRVDFSGYDAVFLQACVEESENTLFKMALNRLQYPYGLADGQKERYQDYLKAHIARCASALVRQRDLEALRFLCKEKLLYGAALAACIRDAAEMEWTEGAADLLQLAATGKEEKKSRYDFDL